MDEHQKMREAVANEYGFSLYRQYGEEQAAHIVSTDHTTLKRWRKKGLVVYIRFGPRQIRYMGTAIADMLIEGVKDE